MIDIAKIDYSVLDRPEVLMFLFHPRPEATVSVDDPTAADSPKAPAQAASVQRDHLVPVENDVVVGNHYAYDIHKFFYLVEVEGRRTRVEGSLKSDAMAIPLPLSLYSILFIILSLSKEPCHPGLYCKNHSFH